MYVIRQSMPDKLITVQENLERDRQELPILQKRVMQPFEHLQEYHQKSNRLAELVQLFDVIANEAPVNEEENLNLKQEVSDEARDLFWNRDSIAAKLEPPSTAIVEALRQRTFEDWVADAAAENWLEQIAQIVGDLDLPVSSLQSTESKSINSLSELMLLERGDEQLVIPRKDVNEQREQLNLF